MEAQLTSQRQELRRSRIELASAQEVSPNLTWDLSGPARALSQPTASTHQAAWLILLLFTC